MTLLTQVLLITLSAVIAECQQQWFKNNYDPHQRIQLDLTRPFNGLFNPFNNFPNQNLFPANPYFSQYFNENKPSTTPNGLYNFPMNSASQEKPAEGQNQPPGLSESTLRGNFSDLPQSQGQNFNENLPKPEPDTKLPGTEVPEASGENNNVDGAADSGDETKPSRASENGGNVDTSGDQDRLDLNLHNTNKPNITKNSDYWFIPVTTSNANQLNPAGVLVNQNFVGPVANADAVPTTDNLTPIVGTANNVAATFTANPGTLSQGVTYSQPSSQYVNVVPQTPSVQANLLPTTTLPNNIAINGNLGGQPNVYSLLTNPNSAVPQSTGGSAPVYYVVYPPQNQVASAGYQVPNSSPILVPLNNQPSNVVMINNQPYSLVPLNNQFNNLVDVTNQPTNLVGFNNRPVSFVNPPYTSVSSNNPPNNLVALNNQPNLVPLNNQPYNFVTLSNQPSNLVSSNQPVTYVPLTNTNAPVLYSLKDKDETEDST